MLRPADEVVPLDRAIVELEAPMWLATFGLERRAILRCQLERGAVIDGRQSARQLPLAPAVQLIGRLVAGIEPAYRLELLGCRIIAVRPFRLMRDLIGYDAEPRKVFGDRLRILVLRTLDIGVVIAQ